MFITPAGHETPNADVAFEAWLLDTREYSLKRVHETRLAWRVRTAAEALKIFRLGYPDYTPALV